MCEYCDKNKVLKSCNFAGSGKIRIYNKGECMIWQMFI